ncbi:hypothetical protein [Bradyrhizobium sp. dw_78]|uniref:hypothetical protein n=1 Tax=Bradyrhizobium sp. dw_78 TaxID=2719793 RepID=UPI001BD445C3|nr:hypothetical protein [Bradyrhizobium sp. dw_78]
MLATLVAAGAFAQSASAQTFSSFTAGDLVVSVEGDGSNTGSYSDNQAAPLTLYEYGLNGTSSTTFAGSMTLPQTASGNNVAISGEYGSSSEGTLQLSGNGQYLTIMGYGVNANAFNANPGAYGPDSSNKALGQSGSLTGQSYTPVSRVVALIGANGSVDTSTALYNVFDQNNPRSVYTTDGKSFYVSGQGNAGSDSTSGVFYTTLGSKSATSITGNDAGGGTSQDTRDVQIYNNTLYTSVDSKGGSNNRDFIGTLGNAGSPPTSVANGSNGPAQLPGFGTNNAGLITITSATSNGLNSGQKVNLSPESFFFANSTTLYVADSGDPKNTKGGNGGDGGLQKWSLVNGSWVLDYTLANGLHLVSSSASSGTSGLYGLTGEVVTVNGQQEVELFATSFSLTDTGQTYLYGITDSLSATSLPGDETFDELAAAPADSDFKGVAFAPVAAVPELSTWGMLLLGFAGIGLVSYRRTRRGEVRFSQA